MKQDNDRPTQPRTRSANSASRGPTRTPMANGLIQFAASRANDLVDNLHERAKQSIERAQYSLTRVDVERVLQGAQPLMVRTGAFARRHPLRSGLILLMAIGAAVLVRTANAKSR